MIINKPNITDTPHVRVGLSLKHFMYIFLALIILVIIIIVFNRTFSLSWKRSDSTADDNDYYLFSCDNDLLNNNVSIVYNQRLYCGISCFAIDNDFVGRKIGHTIKWEKRRDGKVCDFMVKNTTANNDVYSCATSSDILYIINPHTNTSDVMISQELFSTYSDKTLTELTDGLKKEDLSLYIGDTDTHIKSIDREMSSRLLNDLNYVDDYRLEDEKEYFKTHIYIRVLKGLLYRTYITYSPSDDTLFIYDSSKESYDTSIHMMQQSAYVLKDSVDIWEAIAD